MKILLIVNQISSEQSAVWTAAARALGDEVHILGDRPRAGLEAYTPDSAQPDGLVVHYDRPIRIRPHKDHLWWIYRSLPSLLSRLKPRIVHVHSELWGLMVFQSLALHDNVIAHGADNQFRFGSGFEKLLRIRAASYSAKRISGYASWNIRGAELVKSLNPSLPTVVVPAILPDIESLGTRTPTSRDKVNIAFIGRLDDQKGVKDLMGALASLCAETRSRIVFHVIGDGPLINRVRDFSATETNVYGRIDNSTTLRFLRTACDALVIPSRDQRDVKEQFGRVAVEAMGSGVAVLSSDAGSLPDVLGKAGLIFPQGDRGALQKGLERIVLDREYRIGIAAAGRRRFEAEYRPSAVGAKLADFWRSF